MLTGVVVLQPVLSERVLYSVRDNSRDDHPRVQVRGRLRSRRGTGATRTYHSTLDARHIENSADCAAPRRLHRPRQPRADVQPSPSSTSRTSHVLPPTFARPDFEGQLWKRSVRTAISERFASLPTSSRHFVEDQHFEAKPLPGFLTRGTMRRPRSMHGLHPQRDPRSQCQGVFHLRIHPPSNRNISSRAEQSLRLLQAHLNLPVVRL